MKRAPDPIDILWRNIGGENTSESVLRGVVLNIVVVLIILFITTPAVINLHIFLITYLDSILKDRDCYTYKKFRFYMRTWFMV